MPNPSDPRYIEHNKRLREAEKTWKTQYLTNPSEIDIRVADWEDQFIRDFPELNFLDNREAMLLKFREVAQYDPLSSEGKDRFIEEHWFLPEQIF
jgi:hypothetical protein